MKTSGILNPINPHQHPLRRPKLLRDALQITPLRRHMTVMNHRLPLHLIAATRQRDPQPAADINPIRIRYIVRIGDLTDGHEAVEDPAGDGVEVVTGTDGVDRAAVGEAGGVGAEAGDGDADGGVGGEGEGGRGGDWEGVGGEEGSARVDLEEGLEGGDGGGLLGDVADEGVAAIVAGAGEGRGDGAGEEMRDGDEKEREEKGF